MIYAYLWKEKKEKDFKIAFGRYGLQIQMSITLSENITQDTHVASTFMKFSTAPVLSFLETDAFLKPAPSRISVPSQTKHSPVCAEFSGGQ